ncbi:MAG: HAD family hydrolase, partial [Candidatus Binatia bacterium]
TGQDIVTSVNYVRNTFELESLPGPTVLSHLGLGLEFLIRGVLPPTHQHVIAQASEIFLSYYGEHLLDTTALYPHVTDTLAYYAAKQKAVISNKPTAATIALLQGLGIEACFDMVLGGTSTSRKKPHPEQLTHVLLTLGVTPSKAVMVGDDRPDIEAGKSAGVHTCGVIYGLGNQENLIKARPDLIIEDLLELKDHYR